MGHRLGSNKRRVEQALDILRQALLEYLGKPPRGSVRSYSRFDLQRLLNAFVDRFPELTLPGRVRTMPSAVKGARDDVAHDTGAMTSHDALRHLANVRQLLKDLDANAGFDGVDELYGEHLDTREVDVDDRPGTAAAPTASPARTSEPLPPATRTSGAKGKYAPLRRHLLALTDDRWDATFRDVEAVLGGPLPASALRRHAWWSNTTTLVSGKAWLAAGWRTSNVQIREEKVSFVRSGGERGASPASSPDLTFFDNDDVADLKWLARPRDGYVVNVRETLSPDHVVLHRATCSTISAPQARWTTCCALSTWRRESRCNPRGSTPVNAHPEPAFRRWDDKLLMPRLPQVYRSLQRCRDSVRSRKELRTTVVVTHDQEPSDRHSWRYPARLRRRQAKMAELHAHCSVRFGDIPTQSLAALVEDFHVVMELLRSVLNPVIRVPFHLDGDQRGRVAGGQADHIQPAPDAGHLNLPIEADDLSRLGVVPKQVQLHVLLVPDVLLRTPDQRTKFRCVRLREARVHVENEVAPSGLPREPANASRRVLRVNPQLVGPMSAPDDSRHGPAPEIQVQVTRSESDVEPSVHARAEHGCARPVPQISEQPVRQAPPEQPGHSPAPPLGSM